MTNEYRQFLTELADLLEKHDVTFEGFEASGYGGYDCYCSGIDVDQEGVYEGDNQREGSSVSFSRFLDAAEIRDFLNKDHK